MTARRLMLLEDDPSLGETIQARLQKEGHQVTWLTNLKEARVALAQEEQQFDLLILDLGLPDGSGFDIAAEQQGRYPVIILTALNSAEYRLKGYELGASEYIPKPFHLKELLILIDKTMQEQAPPQAQEIYRYEDVIVNTSAMTIESDGQVFYPSARDFSVLVHLIKAYPAAVSREELLDTYWGNDSFPTNRTVDNSILRIRQFLGHTANQLIKSVRGIGYQWIKDES